MQKDQTSSVLIVARVLGLKLTLIIKARKFVHLEVLTKKEDKRTFLPRKRRLLSLKMMMIIVRVHLEAALLVKIMK